MIQYTLLKLYWAHFNTNQVHNLIHLYPQFITENDLRRNELLVEWLTHQSSSSLWKKYEKFKTLKLNNILSTMKHSSLKFVTYFVQEYPQLLKEIYDFPYVIFYKGNLKNFNQTNTLAVIGSRKPTHYTTQALEYLFPSFKQINMTVISGLAKGADSIAHQTSI